jgi:taurine dioxygenase
MSDLDIRRVTPALGAEIHGIDVANADDDTIAAVRQAVLDHLVVMIRGQDDLGIDGLEHFTSRLGEPIETPFVGSLRGHPHVVRVIKEAHETNPNFGGGWHTDLSYLASPPSFTLLWAHDVPTSGGDTMWTNQYRALDGFSPGFIESLKSLKAVHTAAGPYSARGYYAATMQGASMDIQPSDDALAEQEHPIVVRHPETGRDALFVDSGYVSRIAGWTAAESRPLLQMLFAACTHDTNVVRMRWEPGTLGIWDNRATQHQALDDYTGQRRELFRTTTAGAPPIPA